MKEKIRKRILNYLIILLLWTIAAIIGSTKWYYDLIRLGQPADFVRIFSEYYPSYFILWLLTPLVIYLGRKVPFQKGKMARAFAFHIIAGMLFALLLNRLEQTYFFLFTDSPATFAEYSDLVISGTFRFSIYATYWVILFAFYTLRYHMELREKELQQRRLSESLLTAHLETIRSRLQPHFLFNTLQAITVLSEMGEHQKVAKMIELLGNLLRLALDREKEQFVSLEEEMQLLESYLAIEKVRFGDRLSISENIESTAMKALVPSMILQPLVENSIKHGISTNMEGGRIDISAEFTNGSLKLTISDDGPGFSTTANDVRSEGIGIRSVRERLSLLYADRFQFELGESDSGGARVMMMIPRETNQESWIKQ